MKRFMKPFLAAGLLAALAITPGKAAAHDDVPLRGYDGAVLQTTDTAPYSPRQTCGGCHDYDAITSAYHFQQGFDEASGDFNPDKPWLQSPGMYGKW